MYYSFYWALGWLTTIAAIWLLFRDQVRKGHIRTLNERVGKLEGTTQNLREALERLGSRAKPASKRKVTETEPVAVETPFEPTRKPLPWEVRPAAAFAPDPAVSTPVTEDIPAQIIFTDDFGKRLVEWITGHWVYVVAAVSLAFAGIFLVQYGIENGLLSPRLRVLAALALGAALIGGGEYVRRKGGDDADDFFAYIPSTLAAGGLVSLFGGVFSAHSLYGLIGPNTAFAGLALVGIIAISIGWFYGPLLAAVGILGSVLAPFLIGGSSDSAYFLNYYFAAIAVVGLLVDTLRRWGWLSAFGMILTFLAALVTWLGIGSEIHFMAFAMIVAVAAIVVPERNFVPNLQGSMMSEAAWKFAGRPTELTWPSFPVRLAALGFVGAVLASVLIHSEANGTYWLSVTAQMLLAAMAMFWMRGARATEDFALLPVVAFLAGIVMETAFYGPVISAWNSAAIGIRQPETAVPQSVMVLLALCSVLTLAAAWRSFQRTDYPLIWAGAAALTAPIAAILLEVFWGPKDVLGGWTWAIYLIVVAAIMTLLAERSANRDGEERHRFALFALSALSMISFSLFMVLTKGSLTVALGVMVVAAAWMDKRWNLRVMGYFIQLGGVVTAYRLTIDPGLFWGFDAPLWEVSLSFLGVIGLFYVALQLLDGRSREGAVVVLESAIWSFGGIFASLMLARFIEYLGAPYNNAIHAFVGLFAVIWLISGANQLYRLKASAGWVRIARIVLAGLFGGGGLMIVAASLTLGNPIFGIGDNAFGPFLLDSLFIGYVLPALPLAFVALKMPHLHKWIRLGSALVAGVLVASYVIFEIRRFWRGDDLSVPGTSQPELYTYTVAMLVLAAGLLALAYQKRSPLIRKLALAAVGLAVAKVFVIDMAGLNGLIRVVSFLVLGLVLAGLAWVNRWFVAMEAREMPKAQ